jgi:hypothetical protein
MTDIIIKMKIPLQILLSVMMLLGLGYSLETMTALEKGKGCEELQS